MTRSTASGPCGAQRRHPRGGLVEQRGLGRGEHLAGVEPPVAAGERAVDVDHLAQLGGVEGVTRQDVELHPRAAGAGQVGHRALAAQPDGDVPAVAAAVAQTDVDARAGEDEVRGVHQVEPALPHPGGVAHGEACPRAGTGPEQDLELDAVDTGAGDPRPEGVVGRREPDGSGGIPVGRPGTVEHAVSQRDARVVRVAGSRTQVGAAPLLDRAARP